MATQKKRILGAVVAIALFTGITVLTFAFKADVTVTDKKVSQALVTQWYSLTLTSGNPNSAEHQKLGGTIEEQPTGEDCNIGNEGNPCAVELSYPDSISTFPSGTTVQEAIDAGATVGDYTREPQ